ncbi:MAG: hypothetical protein NPIRA05_15770 [Nitrospirales bacterium]|nr:MAG: hypothetical protein NPIRA05_15770 [Nitrospirales bacterium]
MRQILNKPWVVLGLCGVALLIVYLNMDAIAVDPATSKRRAQDSSARSSVNGTVNTSSATTMEIDVAQMDWPETLARDPFAPVTNQDSHMQSAANIGKRQGLDISPLTERRAPMPQLQLTAVMLKPEPKLAMINRELMAEGDCVDDLCVTQIASDGVWFEGPSGPHHLVFGRDDSVRPTLNQQGEEDARRSAVRARSVNRDT